MPGSIIARRVSLAEDVIARYIHFCEALPNGAELAPPARGRTWLDIKEVFAEEWEVFGELIPTKMNIRRGLYVSMEDFFIKKTPCLVCIQALAYPRGMHILCQKIGYIMAYYMRSADFPLDLFLM